MSREGSPSRNVLPVVRSSGERTAARCGAVLAAALECEPLTISETPFHRSLEVTFQRALDAGCDWLLTCDGDVVPREHEVGKLVALAQRIPGRYYQLVGQIQDKLFDRARPGGIRLYRASSLPTVLEVLPGTDAVRPESGLYGLMARRGHPVAVCNVVTGHHDYEQYYRDVYRTAHFHAFKNVASVARAAPAWRAAAATDPDFTVALLGAGHGLADPVTTSDTSLFAEATVGELLAGIGLAEKPPLAEDAELDLGPAPAARPARWWTDPFPPKLLDQAREYRRCKVPVTRELAKRAAIAVANRLVADPDNRLTYHLPDLLA